MLKEPIEVLGRFEGGGLGELLRCRDADGILFAAKFPKDQSTTSQRLIVDEERRFHRHQGAHVVQYYGTIHHTDGRRGFAMELMEGSLASLVESGPIRTPRAVAYFADAVAGLTEVHSSARGAYHGDIKPANILYKNGTAKLADFGLARGGVGQTQMAGPHDGGTPGYFPPEGYTSSAGDVYSLGVTLWSLISGRHPPATGPDMSVSLRPLLADTLNRMVSRDPTSRPSARDLAVLLPRLRQESPDWLGAIGKVAGVAAVVGLGAFILGGLLRKR